MSSKYCEYVFYGVTYSASGFAGPKISPDISTTAGLVHNIESPSNFAGVFIGGSAVMGPEAYGGAVAPGGVYSEIIGGENYLAGSVGVAFTWYVQIQPDWVYEEANITWKTSLSPSVKDGIIWNENDDYDGLV